MDRCRLHVMGASGTGTTTVGRAIAQAWAVPHADSDDYFWQPTTPPYVTARPVQEKLDLMQAMFVPRDAWVLSGAITKWGAPVIAKCDAVVFLTLDTDERLRRLEARERLRRGSAAVEDEAWLKFREWARRYDDPSFSGRSRRGHDEWLEGLAQPVLRLDSGQPLEQLLDRVRDW